MAGKISIGHKSIKHEIISNANTKMLIAVGVATFVFVFSIFSAKALLSQSFYNGRLISAKEKAKEQLEDNSDALTKLKQTYDSFAAQETNILGGISNGDGAIDGLNPDIVLDALPNRYDYASLSSSIERILKDGGYQITTIGGRQDIGLANMSAAVGTATPIEIPYSFTVQTSLEGTRKLVDELERWIRPVVITGLQLKLGDATIQTQISMKTYFTQPKTFEVKSEVVK